MAKEWGDELEGSILADASAALGIIARRGVGKVRHLDCSHLWLQEAAATKAVKFGKIAGAENCADILTKAIDAKILEKHLETMQMSYSPYRTGDDEHGGPVGTVAIVNKVAKKVRYMLQSVARLRHGSNTSWASGKQSKVGFKKNAKTQEFAYTKSLTNF